jgi:hypothetical protein
MVSPLAFSISDQMEMKMRVFLKKVFVLVLLSAAAPFGQLANAQNYINHDGVNSTPAADAFLVRAGTLAPTAGFNWRYTFTQPASNWFQTSFSDSGWALGRGSFARGGLQPGDASTNIAWPNNQSQLWLRSTFNVSDPALKHSLMFWGRWDDNIRIYINGIEAIHMAPIDPNGSAWASSYRYLGMSQAARDSIVQGVNHIAVHVVDHGGGAHLNLGLVKSYAMANLPITGYYKSNHFLPILNHVKNEMSLYGVSAGSISIALNNGGTPDIFASAGIGYMTKALNTRVPRHAVFRTASLDKPPARSAIRKMVADGIPSPARPGHTLSLNEPVFSIIRAVLLKHGLPTLTGAPSYDIDTITIQEILDHTSGITTSLGLPDQGSILGNIRWIYAQPVESHRGTYAYNNNAHVVLRYLVHLLAFENGYGDYNDYIRDELLSASNDKNFYVAWQDLNNRVNNVGGMREPWYNTEHFFWPGEGIRNVLGGAATTDAYTRYLIHIPNSELWNGGMSGSQAYSRRGTYVDLSGRVRNYAFTLMFNSGFQPRAEQRVVSLVDSAIRSLPCTAWSASGTTCP